MRSVSGLDPSAEKERTLRDDQSMTSRQRSDVEEGKDLVRLDQLEAGNVPYADASSTSVISSYRRQNAAPTLNNLAEDADG